MPYGTLATDAISTTGNLAITGNTITTGALVASNMPGRNRFINGAMAVDQRNAGASQTIATTATTVTYTVDRWYATATGANVTGQQVAGTVSNTYNYRFTGAASVTAINFGQRIEALNSADLAGTTATLSVDLANSLLTTVTWTAFYANTANTFGNISTPTRTQIATGTFTVNSTVTRYTTSINIPAAATTGIEIVFSVGAQTSGTWTIGNAQFEAGAFATPFERRFVQQDLMWSQRYYYRILANASSPGTAVAYGGYAYSATNSSQSAISLPTTMRANPTSTQSGLSLAQSAGNWAVTAIAATTSSTTSGSLSFQIGTSSLTTGQGVMVYFAGATGYLDFSAEL